MRDRAAVPALTTLRFFAAFYVLLLHGASGYFRHTVASSFMDTGYVAVDFFFVLSGFVLTYRYVSSAGEMIGTQRDFWAARVARIYPVYLFSFALSAWPYLVSLAHGETTGSLIVKATISAIASLLLMQSWFYRTSSSWNGPAWSLSVEAFLYAVFPWLAPRLFRSQRSPVVLVASLWLLALATPTAYLLANPDHLGHVNVHSPGAFISSLRNTPLLHLPAFLIGVVTAQQYVRHRRPLAGWVLPALLLATLGVCAIGDSLPFPMVHNGLFAPLFATVIYAAAASRGPVVRALEWRPLVELGEASYALYLIHLPLLNCARLICGHNLTPAQFIACAVGITLLSLVLYRWLEVPMRSRVRSLLAAPRSAQTQ